MLWRHWSLLLNTTVVSHSDRIMHETLNAKRRNGFGHESLNRVLRTEENSVQIRLPLYVPFILGPLKGPLFFSPLTQSFSLVHWKGPFSISSDTALHFLLIPSLLKWVACCYVTEYTRVKLIWLESWHVLKIKTSGHAVLNCNWNDEGHVLSAREWNKARRSQLHENERIGLPLYWLWCHIT
jgi:hypothetical protein